MYSTACRVCATEIHQQPVRWRCLRSKTQQRWQSWSGRMPRDYRNWRSSRRHWRQTRSASIGSILKCLILTGTASSALGSCERSPGRWGIDLTTHRLRYRLPLLLDPAAAITYWGVRTIFIAWTELLRYRYSRSKGHDPLHSNRHFCCAPNSQTDQQRTRQLQTSF